MRNDVFFFLGPARLVILVVLPLATPVVHTVRPYYSFVLAWPIIWLLDEIHSTLHYFTFCYFMNSFYCTPVAH